MLQYALTEFGHLLNFPTHPGVHPAAVATPVGTVTIQ